MTLESELGQRQDEASQRYRDEIHGERVLFIDLFMP